MEICLFFFVWGSCEFCFRVCSILDLKLISWKCWFLGWLVGLGWVGLVVVVVVVVVVVGDAGFSWKKIRNPGAVGRLSYEFAGTMNARRILPEKRQGIWGSWYSAHFHWKTHESARVGHPWHINLQSRWSPGAFYMRKHKESGGVGGSDI